ncbi:hypothetical protein CVB88_23810, partial [Salmonella enterica subsp. enterica serovar Enteritidis]|uniref:hypothetical protein n=1 Tax=Salmonella enterica TaxID=28901 RepID=UPI000CCB0F94
DYTVWRDNLGGIFTSEHYTIWKSHFGQLAGDGAVTAVPESVNLSILLAALVCYLHRRQMPRAAQ